MKAHGLVTLEDGTTFEGQLVLQAISGTGVLKCVSGDVYQGTMVDGMYCGAGELRTSDGREYKGLFNAGTLDGEGEYSDATGLRYVGGFKKGVFHGRGELRRCGILVYNGEWRDGLYHGNGEIVQGNYDFRGEFVNGKKCGFGIEKTDRWEYVGEYDGGKYHGQGILRRETSSAYGTFLDGDLVAGLIRCNDGDIIQLKMDQNLKIIKAKKTSPSGEVQIGVWAYPDIVEIGQEVRDMIWRYREKLLKRYRDDLYVSALKKKYLALQTLIERRAADYSAKIDSFQEKSRAVAHYDVHFQHYAQQAYRVMGTYTKLLLSDSEQKTRFGANWSSSAFRLEIGRKCEIVSQFIAVVDRHARRLQELCQFDAERLKDILCFLQIKLQQKAREIAEIVSQSTLEFSHMTVYQIFFALDSVDDNLPELSQADAQRLTAEIEAFQAKINSGDYGQNATQQRELENALQYAQFIDDMIQFNYTAQDNLEQYEENANRLSDLYKCEAAEKAPQAAKGKKVKIACGMF